MSRRGKSAAATGVAPPPTPSVTAEPTQSTSADNNGTPTENTNINTQSTSITDPQPTDSSNPIQPPPVTEDASVPMDTTTSASEPVNEEQPPPVPTSSDSSTPNALTAPVPGTGSPSRSPTPTNTGADATSTTAPTKRASGRVKAIVAASTTTNNASSSPPNAEGEANTEALGANGRPVRASRQTEKEKEKKSGTAEGEGTMNSTADNKKRGGKREASGQQRDRGRKKSRVGDDSSSHAHSTVNGDLDGEDGGGSDVNEEVPAGGEGDELYCICRQPYDAKRFMIGCDKCDGWFHARCVNLTVALAQVLHNFVCPPCRKNKSATSSKEQQLAEQETAIAKAEGAIEDEELDEMDGDLGEGALTAAQEEVKVERKRGRKPANEKGGRGRSPSPVTSSRRGGGAVTPMEEDSTTGGGRDRKKRSASALGMDEDEAGTATGRSRGGRVTTTVASSAVDDKNKRRRDDSKTASSKPSGGTTQNLAVPSTNSSSRRRETTGKPPIPQTSSSNARGASDRRQGDSRTGASSNVGGLKDRKAGEPRRSGTGRIINSPSWRSQGLDDDDGGDMDDLDLDDSGGHGSTQFYDRSERRERERGDHGHHHHHHSSHHHSSHGGRIDWHAAGEEYSSEEEDELDGVYLTSDEEEANQELQTNLDQLIQQQIQQREDMSQIMSRQPGYIPMVIEENSEGLVTNVSQGVNTVDMDASTPPRPPLPKLTVDGAVNTTSPQVSPRHHQGTPPHAAGDTKALRKVAGGDSNGGSSSLLKRSLLIDARAISQALDDLGDSLLHQSLTLPPPPPTERQAQVTSEVAAAAAKVDQLRNAVFKHAIETAAAAAAAATGGATTTNATDPTTITGNDGDTEMKTDAAAPTPKTTAPKTEPVTNGDEQKSDPSAVPSATDAPPKFDEKEAERIAQALSEQFLEAHQSYLNVLVDPELISPLPLHKATSPELVDHQLVLHMERKKTDVECQILELEQKRRLYLSALAVSQRLSVLQSIQDEVHADDHESDDDHETAILENDRERKHHKKYLDQILTSPTTITHKSFPLSSALEDMPIHLPNEPSTPTSSSSPTTSTTTTAAASGSVTPKDDLLALGQYRSLLTGLFPPADEDSNPNATAAEGGVSDIYTSASALLDSELLSSRSAPHGVLPLGRLIDLSLEFFQCPACYGLIPAPGFHLHTTQCSLPSSLSADPNIQQPPPFNQNYPPTYHTVGAHGAHSTSNSAQIQNQLLPLPLPVNLPFHNRTRKRPPYKAVNIPRDSAHTNVASNIDRQQAYAAALHEIDGRLSRLAAAKWDLGPTQGQDVLTTICACPIVEGTGTNAASNHNPTTTSLPSNIGSLFSPTGALLPFKFCPLRKSVCTSHLLWEDLWKSDMEQQYFILCRRLELLKCELECVRARIHDRALQHGLQTTQLTQEELALEQQAQAQALERERLIALETAQLQQQVAAQQQQQPQQQVYYLEQSHPMMTLEQQQQQQHLAMQQQQLLMKQQQQMVASQQQLPLSVGPPPIQMSSPYASVGLGVHPSTVPGSQESQWLMANNEAAAVAAQQQATALAQQQQQQQLYYQQQQQQAAAVAAQQQQQQQYTSLQTHHPANMPVVDGQGQYYYQTGPPAFNSGAYEQQQYLLQQQQVQQQQQHHTATMQAYQQQQQQQAAAAQQQPVQ